MAKLRAAGTQKLGANRIMSAGLYVDGAAFNKMCRSLGLDRPDIEQLLLIAEEHAGQIVEKCWFDASPDNRHTTFHYFLQKNGFKVNLGCLIQKSFTDQHGIERTEQKQQGVDVDLAVTAMCSHNYGKWQHLVLVAGDGDFEPLVRKLDDLGCTITLISTRSARSSRLLPYVTVVNLEDCIERLSIAA